jgi:tRNA nucleotidyltransferase (CCA-adding enzyme)
MKRALAVASEMIMAANKRFLSSSGSSASPAPALLPAPPLTNLESRIFDVLLAVVNDRSLGLTLRVAGGWVRDKLLLPGGLDNANKTGTRATMSAAEVPTSVSGVPAAATAAVSGTASHSHTHAHPVSNERFDLSVDIDIALDNMMGEQFAEHVSQWLVANNHPPASYGVIASNPDQSKHLATARMKVLGIWVDLVNLRTETYAKATSRIPDVEIGTPFEDAMRRDLTINALFYNINNRIIEDFTGNGVADIRARIVRTPLAPLTTLLDDPLRALRAIRFASRLNFMFDPELYNACKDPLVHAALGAKVSRERVSSEIDSIMSSSSPIHALGLLSELGLFPVVFRLPLESEYVGDKRPPPDFSSAALGCLINLDMLAQHPRAPRLQPHIASPSVVASNASGTAPPSTPTVPSCPVTTRTARYAALLAPIADVSALFGEAWKKRRPAPLAQYILRTELRMGAKDVASVVNIHQSSLEFKALVHSGGQRVAAPTLTGTPEAEAIATSSGRTDSIYSAARAAAVAGLSSKGEELDRLTVGRMLRSAGPLWRVALQTALITELSPASAAETYASGMTAISEELAMETAVVVETYSEFQRKIEEMGFEGVWDLKPLIDGRALSKLLPGLPRGPIVGSIMNAQTDFMMQHPEATQESVRQWILEEYTEYQCTM